MARHRCVLLAALVPAGLLVLGIVSGRALAREPLLVPERNVEVFADEVDPAPATREA